jgi:hypothetical protein
MPFEAGHEHATGRPKGVGNKSTEAIRSAFAMLVEDNLSNMQDWLDRTAQQNPHKALQIVSDLAQYSLPKMRQVDANIELGDSLINKVTIEVANGKRAENTSNNSIPEELGS